MHRIIQNQNNREYHTGHKFIKKEPIKVVQIQIFWNRYIVASVVVGLPFLGGLMWDALAPVGWRIPTAMVMLLCYAAVFTFIAMQDSNKSRSLIISFVFALVIILGGLYIYSALQQPEFTWRMVLQEDGSFLRQEGIPNSKYIRGTARTVYTFIEACIPSTQGLNIALSDGALNPLAIICQLCVTIATTATGVSLFKKKDIK